MAEKQGAEGAEFATRIKICTRRGLAQRIEIEISDNGPGMSSEVKLRACEPLFSTKGFGVGLGLATVKQIMEQHRGGIEISSAAGADTRVVLWLPDMRDA